MANICRVCNRPDCDDDCEELRYIYRERQKEIARDIELEPGRCYLCECKLADPAATDMCYSCKEEMAWEQATRDIDFADD